MDTKFRFTKATIDKFQMPEKRLRLRDTAQEGLILELAPSGSHTFRVYKKIKGRSSPVTVTLGKYPGISIENARKQAIAVLNEIGCGVNPNKIERAKRKGNISLGKVYEDYKKVKDLKSSTIRGYDSVMASHLAPYSKKPLSRITENDVKKIHREVTVSSPALADLVMRFLRAIFNFARYEYRGLNRALLFEHNPVQILNHQRLWNNVARRHARLTQGQLPGWFVGVQAVREQGGEFVVSVCDMVEMAVLTGLRRGELISLTWDHVSMAEGTYYLSTTKNGDPLELPLTNYVRSVLERRLEQGYDSAYVFSAPNKYGQIKEPKKVIAQIVDKSGVEFTLHDLRRTFTTTAEGLNVGAYSVGIYSFQCG